MESIEHALLCCKWTEKVWWGSSLQIQINQANITTFDSWFLEMATAFLRAGWKKGEGEAQIASIAWQIWKDRCSFIMEGKIIDPRVTLSKFNAYRIEFLNSRIVGPQSQTNSTNTSLRWTPPPLTWIKINSDAAFSDLSRGAVAVVCRDSNGSLIGGHACHVLCGSAQEAETLAVKQACLFARQLGKSCIILELDALAVFNAITSSNIGCPWEIKSIVDDIKVIATEIDQVRFQYTKRTANRAADWVAKQCMRGELAIDWVSNVPPSLVNIFVHDLSPSGIG